jgi:hypothetical protein
VSFPFLYLQFVHLIAFVKLKLQFIQRFESIDRLRLFFLIVARWRGIYRWRKFIGRQRRQRIVGRRIGLDAEQWFSECGFICEPGLIFGGFRGQPRINRRLRFAGWRCRLR